jgi:predicted regulator of amino acid metabolism with ACT domain
MWKQISNYFGRYPSQAKVAKLLLEIYSGDIELGDVAIGKAVGVDRRIVKAAVETIESSPDLMRVFSKLKPTAFLKDVVSEMGWSAIEIIPNNAATFGIIADVTGVIATSGISIRQAIVTDPDLSEEPRLFIITESMVPPEMIPRLRNCKGVKAILIH